MGAATPIQDTEMSEVAERVKRNAGALHKSRLLKVSFVASPENVENLNYLQCAWAHTVVYSNRRDFSFAKRCSTPQYCDLVKVRLAAVSGSSATNTNGGTHNAND
jgi:hypothetical protein